LFDCLFEEIAPLSSFNTAHTPKTTVTKKKHRHRHPILRHKLESLARANNEPAEIIALVQLIQQRPEVGNHWLAARDYTQGNC